MEIVILMAPTSIIFTSQEDNANYSPLKCALPNTTLSRGEWVDPNGMPLSCNPDPLHCNKSNNSASISLYRPNHNITFTEVVPKNNFYKCCLPSSSSGTSTNKITVNINIFSKLYLILLLYTVICYQSTVEHVQIIVHNIVELPSDMTVVPQQYTVQCILSGIKKTFQVVLCI